MNNRLILVTSGEPSGIGPDICLDLANISFSLDVLIVVIGSIKLLKLRAKLLKKKVKLINFNEENVSSYNNIIGELLVLDIKCNDLDCISQLKLANASYVIQMLDKAIDLCKKGLSNKIVTAPIHKGIINQSGLTFSGHTEYFAEKFGTPHVVMMLGNKFMKVALLTIHIPLSMVPKYVNEANLNQVLEIIVKFFKIHLNIQNPKIAVCGLNPHAGEGGYLGYEEVEVINPVIEKWQDNGFNVTGSYSADTIYNNSDKFDVILAMYHDQGLPVLKYSDFEHGVNVTLGLPIIRTSVDHGTALDLAGTGLAKSNSLISAIQFAIFCNQG